MNVTRPDDDYDNPKKDEYRREVWNALAPHYVPGSYVLMMPSSNGKEILEAVNRGIPINRIICVDRSLEALEEAAANIGSDAFLSIDCELVDLPDLLSDYGISISLANLDLCGQVSQDTVDAVAAIYRRLPWTPQKAFAVNVMKGRENTTFNLAMKKIGAQFLPDLGCSDPRQVFLCWAIDEQFPLQCAASGEYRSTSPFTWAVFATTSNVLYRKVKLDPSDITHVYYRAISKKWISTFYIGQKYHGTRSYSTREEAERAQIDWRTKHGLPLKRRKKQENQSEVRGVTFSAAQNKWILRNKKLGVNTSSVSKLHLENKARELWMAAGLPWHKDAKIVTVSKIANRVVGVAACNEFRADGSQKFKAARVINGTRFFRSDFRSYETAAAYAINFARIHGIGTGVVPEEEDRLIHAAAKQGMELAKQMLEVQ